MRVSDVQSCVAEETMHFLVWILSGLIAGWAAGKIMKGEGYGAFLDILLGIAGGWVGGFITERFGVGGGGFVFSTCVAIGGAILLVALVHLIKK
jgi:uncharacterized membrane protein YeaQ/YmgE (transglycosylase-associated protein family)